MSRSSYFASATDRAAKRLGFADTRSAARTAITAGKNAVNRARRSPAKTRAMKAGAMVGKGIKEKLGKR